MSGSYVLKKGEKADAFYVIKKGKVHILAEDNVKWKKICFG